MPIDFIVSSGTLNENHLQLGFIAHSKCDKRKVSVAARAFPGKGLTTRRQIASQIKWRRGTDGFNNGQLSIRLENADSAIVMLSYAGHLVRRNWFVDPVKATNSRLVAMQVFDRELKQLRQALLESTDAFRFEQGVTALLFLLGFAPAPVLETQAPDIVVVAPSGAVAIIECTTRIADFAAKIGKLVDRRQVLLAQLEAVGHAMPVQAFLVSSQPRAQIAAEATRLAGLKVLLLTREDILEGLTRTRWPGSPDQLLVDASKRLSAHIPM